MSNNQNQGASIEAERAACIEIVKRLGWTINGTWVFTPSGEQLHTLDALAFIREARRTPGAAVGSAQAPVVREVAVKRHFSHDHVTKAWAYLRRNENTIPDDALDDMREVLRGSLATVTAPAQPARSVAKVHVTHGGYGMQLATYIAYALPEGDHELYAAPAAQQAAPMGTLGYALFRNGKQEGIERSREMAERWVKAEIVPLIAAPATAGMVDSAGAKLLISNEIDEKSSRVSASINSGMVEDAKDAARVVELPEHEVAMAAVETGTANPIDIFVYNHEPAGDSDEYHFRAQLQSALDYVAAPNMEYRTCCDHPDCTRCAGRGGFYRMAAQQAQDSAKEE